ncbi:MAG TPA: TolC family protein, partial [Humisphaera sp.]|nr:TolC family protein [Humisphaera sp.]
MIEIHWRNPARRTAVALLISLMALILAGCEPASPQRRHLDETDRLIIDRTGQKFDAGELLKLARPAQSPPTGALTLEEAVARSLQHNNALIAATENLTIARAQVAQASLVQNPTLGQSNGLLFPFASHGLPSFDINVTQVINSILTQPSRVAVARLAEMQAQIDLAAQGFGLSQQAQSKYQELSHLIRSRRNTERVVEVYGRAVKAAEARQQVGLIPMPELNRARLNYTDAVRQVRHLQTQYQRAAQEMNWLMGLSSPPLWKLSDDALQPPQELPPPPEIPLLESAALKYRLDLLRGDFDRRLGEFGVKLARAGLIPNTTVGAEFARDNTKRWVGGPVFDISIPIFDPGLVALTLAEDQSRKADKTYAALCGQVLQDVRTAQANFQIASDDLRFFREKLIPQQEQNVALMQESFRLGNDDLDALLNTLRDYVAALQSYEDATQAYQDSSTALQAAVGLAWNQMMKRAGA